MRKRESHWPALTYYHPCLDFSESDRANADVLINIHEPSSSIVLSAFYMLLVGEFVVLSWGHFISSTIIDLIAQILFKLN